MAMLTEFTPFTYHVFVLVVVMCIKYVVDHFVKLQPLRFFQFYCLQLNNKVNKSSNSPQQQTIAGLMALLITLAPISIILWLFADFIAVEYAWHGLLLYFSFGNFNLGKINKTVAQDLDAKKNSLVKDALAPFLLRETKQLSVVGLSKAAIEMHLLRSMQQIYVVAFIFVVLGPLAAISYRLILEMHYSWNTKLSKNKQFGFYSHIISQILQWLPSRLMALLILLSSVGRGGLLFWRLSRIHFFKLNSDFVISVHAFSLAVKLGGVAMYGENKVRKIAFNELGKQPEPRDMINALYKVNFAVLSSLFLLILFALAVQFVAQS